MCKPEASIAEQSEKNYQGSGFYTTYSRGMDALEEGNASIMHPFPLTQTAPHYQSYFSLWGRHVFGLVRHGVCS